MLQKILHGFIIYFSCEIYELITAPSQNIVKSNGISKIRHIEMIFSKHKFTNHATLYGHYQVDSRCPEQLRAYSAGNYWKPQVDQMTKISSSFYIDRASVGPASGSGSISTPRSKERSSTKMIQCQIVCGEHCVFISITMEMNLRDQTKSWGWNYQYSITLILSAAAKFSTYLIDWWNGGSELGSWSDWVICYWLWIELLFKFAANRMSISTIIIMESSFWNVLKFSKPWVCSGPEQRGDIGRGDY